MFRTLHLQGVGRTDFPLWYSDIQRAAGGKGNALREQQMSRSDIPIIVDSCIAFITQYGEELPESYAPSEQLRVRDQRTFEPIVLVHCRSGP